MLAWILSSLTFVTTPLSEGCSLSVTAEETESEPECQRLSLFRLLPFLTGEVLFHCDLLPADPPCGLALLWRELYIHILKSPALQKIILFEEKKKDCCRWDCLSWGPTGGEWVLIQYNGYPYLKRRFGHSSRTSIQTIRVIFCSLQEWVCWCLVLLIFASRTNSNFLLGHSVFRTLLQQP